MWRAAPWARATKNVKKPQSQMCESCRKGWFKIFVKPKHFWFQSHIWFWGLLLYKTSFNKQNKNRINHINDNHIRFEVSLHFLESGLLCGGGSFLTYDEISTAAVLLAPVWMIYTLILQSFTLSFVNFLSKNLILFAVKPNRKEMEPISVYLLQCAKIDHFSQFPCGLFTI